MRVLLTGANGFVGRELCVVLSSKGHTVRGAIREDRPGFVKVVGVEYVAVGNVNAETSWQDSLSGCDVVVHLVARVHAGDSRSTDRLAEFRVVNTDGTLSLARQAAKAGVRRLVFVSSVKVNGEGSNGPYRETDVPAPADAYAISKWEAEQGLRRIAQETGLEVVILRPPLVYGPGVKANFLELIRGVQKGWPLPLGAVHNRRSLLYVGNLVDAVSLCVEHPDAAGQTFLLDDGEAVSTPDLVRALAKALGQPARLVKVPVGVLKVAGALLGKSTVVARLTGSLFVDDSAIRSRLNWSPPFSMKDGLAATVSALP